MIDRDEPDRWDLHDHDPLCMEDDCDRLADWRSEDGYPFCNWHAYELYRAECELENLEPHTASMWMLHGRPHGPLGGEPQWLTTRTSTPPTA